MIYVASQVTHATKWRGYRHAGYPIISTWIDEAGPSQSADLSNLWVRCCLEAKTADVLVAYRERHEVLKGALIEIGVALYSPKPVLLAGHWEDAGSFIHHPTVKRVPTLNEAMAMAMRICKHLKRSN